MWKCILENKSLFATTFYIDRQVGCGKLSAVIGNICWEAKRMKRIWLFMLVLITVLTMGFGPDLAAARESQQPLTDRQVRINANVAGIFSRRQQKIGEVRQVATKGEAMVDSQAVESYAQQIARDCVAEIDAYLKSEGLVDCGRYDGGSLIIGDESTGESGSSDFVINSLTSDLVVYQQAVKDLDGSIYYYAYWDWAPQYNYDLIWDTYDLVSAQIEDDDGWQWRSMECQTWDQWGVETGFTDGNPWNTRGDSVTLRDDFWMGKIFNLHDAWNPVLYSYKTDTVRIAGWITPGSTSTNRVRSNFEHNWKTFHLQPSASITSAQIVSFTLSVSYSNVHYNWQRGSNALEIQK